MNKCILARTQNPDSLMSPAQKHWKVSDHGCQLLRKETNADLPQEQGGPPKGDVLPPSWEPYLGGKQEGRNMQVKVLAASIA